VGGGTSKDKGEMYGASACMRQSLTLIKLVSFSAGLFVFSGYEGSACISEEILTQDLTSHLDNRQ